VSGFTVDATAGALTALAGLPMAGNLQCPEFMAVAPAQKFLFVPDESSEEIHSYAIGSDGSLTAGGTEPWPVTGDPWGTFVYVGEDSNATMISAFNYSSLGVLNPITGTPFAPAGTFNEGIVIAY
jgi:6-phosphogluconolactonase (cycloisomerase 2 family)